MQFLLYFIFNFFYFIHVTGKKITGRHKKRKTGRHDEKKNQKIKYLLHGNEIAVNGKKAFCATIQKKAQWFLIWKFGLSFDEATAKLGIKHN